MTEKSKVNPAVSGLGTYIENKLNFFPETKFDLKDLQLMGASFYMTESLTKDEFDRDKFLKMGANIRQMAIMYVVADSGMNPDEWAMQHLKGYSEWLGEHADA